MLQMQEYHLGKYVYNAPFYDFDIILSVFSIAPFNDRSLLLLTLLETRYSTMANTSDKKLATVNAISWLQWRTIDRYPGYILWRKNFLAGFFFPLVWFEDQVGQERGEGSTIIPMLDPSTVLRYSRLNEVGERFKLFCAPPTETTAWRRYFSRRRVLRGRAFFASHEDDPSDLPILPLFILSQIITPDEGARPLIYLIPFLKISYRFRLGEMTCRDRSGRVV